MTEGQYGDFLGLRVGDCVKITALAEVVEVGRNYADVEIEDGGDELTIGADWTVELADG